ncbi:hypothetical protein AB0L88_03500 [Saccharopolyspora shandongensis]|uniref:hypothetical protein n=1 Tax=Saccharopolyspora shandongensis TaxID=418495 RepID=UPI00341363F3
MQQIHVQLTGKGVVTLLVTVALVLGVLALVWLLVTPAWAIGIGAGLVLLVRGVFWLFKPHSE